MEMKEKNKQKGFIPILILLGAFLLVSTGIATTVGVVKYKEEIKSGMANISSAIFKSDKSTKYIEESVIPEETATYPVIDRETEKTQQLNQDSIKEIERLKAENKKANAETEKLIKEKEEIEEQARLEEQQKSQKLLEEQQWQEELQKQQEAQKIAEEQKELEKKQADEKERIANIEFVDEDLSQFISEIQGRINTFSQAKNEADDFISTVRNTMNKYPNSSLMQQSGQQLINEINNFSSISKKLIDFDNSRIRTISSFLGSGDVPSSSNFSFSKSEYDNYFDQYNTSDTQIDSLIKTFVNNEKIVLDEKIEEAQEELSRKTKATQALTQLNAVTQEINSQLAVLGVQIQEKEDEIEQTENALASMSYINGKLSQLIPQLNSLIDQWNILIDEKEKISVITYKLDDYFNYGTPLPAEDRAFLASLGISF